MKIVGPTIVEPWRAAIEGTKTPRDAGVGASHAGLHGAGPGVRERQLLLFTAYRELKRLEAQLYNRMADRFPKSVDVNQRTLGFVTTTNFYGMDVNPFAVEIAKVTMSAVRLLSIDELHVSESALPLDNLDSNIVHRGRLGHRYGEQVRVAHG